MTRTRTKLCDPGRRTVRLHWPEADTEAAVDHGAALMRWTMLSTSRRRKGVKCPVCGHFAFPQGGDGCTPGLPDRFIQTDALRDALGGVYLGVELKGSQTALSPEQKALRDAGRIVVARDWDEVTAAIAEVERRVRRGRNG